MIPLVSGGFLLPTCGMRHHWKIELLEALKLSFLEWTLRFFGYQLTHINILSSGWVLIPSLVDSCAFCWWSNHARDLFLSISHSHQHPDGSMVMVQRSQTHIFWGFPDFPHHSEENYGAVVAGAALLSRACLHRPERGIVEQPLGTATMRGFQSLVWGYHGDVILYILCVYIYVYIYTYN